MKVEDQRPVASRRDAPDDHLLTVGGVERDLLRAGKPGLGGRRALPVRMILQRALHDVHQHDEDAEPGRHDDQSLQRGHVR
jgi:hypothetical protein